MSELQGLQDDLHQLRCDIQESAALHSDDLLWHYAKLVENAVDRLEFRVKPEVVEGVNPDMNRLIREAYERGRRDGLTLTKGASK